MRRRQKPSPKGAAHEVFLEFIEKELRTERERKHQIAQLGTGLITTSGTLTTLLFAVGALVSTQKGFHPSLPTVALLTCTLAAFSASAIFGISASRLSSSSVAKPSSFDKLIEEHWRADIADARKVVARTHRNTLETLRKANGRRAQLVSVGQTFQIAAVLMLTGAVYTILISRH